ncbi:hypothetical protein ACF059_31285 [Streptomyces sp. NPDC016562]|uniref:hypothetical protein n=1 Tax=Streptomyces sp. NPDC016562 TaxID=3364966 RepID=UPI0037016ED0
MIKNNPEVFAALVAALGIAGGIVGNAIGSALQAWGGRAQANAAVMAARITAEADRLAALREERRIELAAFIRAARETVQQAALAFVYPDQDDQIKANYEDTLRLAGQAELVVPTATVPLLNKVIDAVEAHVEIALSRGEAGRALRHLARIEPEHPLHQPAHRAYNLLGDLRTAYAVEENEGEQLAFRSAARTALDDLPWLDDRQREVLLRDTLLPPLEDIRQVLYTQSGDTLDKVVEAARAILRADDLPESPVP